jgi:hypothetical protein
MRWDIFTIAVTIQLIATTPDFVQTCDACSSWPFAVSLNMFHHVFDVFLFWSFLFLTTKLDFQLHFWLAIAILIHWATYDNKCILTVILNRYCGYPEEAWFDSIKNRLGLRDISEWFHFYWIAALLLLDLYYMTIL